MDTMEYLQLQVNTQRIQVENLAKLMDNQADLIQQKLKLFGEFVDENGTHINGFYERIQTVEKREKSNHRIIGLLLIIQVLTFIFDITIKF